ncbi:MAG: hypothetical protein R3300_21425, partial [Candidatus Promineifilaceae bacterium]|nr:hypothetical protein [Candidatus Promineifilaceae bacterium]
MRRARRSSALINLLKDQPAPNRDGSYWDDLNRRIRHGKIIPIISNSVHGDLIFDYAAAPADAKDDVIESGMHSIDPQQPPE